MEKIHISTMVLKGVWANDYYGFHRFIINHKFQPRGFVPYYIQTGHIEYVYTIDTLGIFKLLISCNLGL